VSKWRFTPLLVVVAAALTAFMGEPRALASEIAKIVGLVAFVVFLLLFATRHQSDYRAGQEPRRGPESAGGSRARRLGRSS
jgi:hypothetical protein